MQDDADETIARIAAALRPLPDVDPAQKARVLVAVAAERERERRRNARRGRLLRLVGGGASLIAAGLVGALWLRSAQTEPRAEMATAGSVQESRADLPPAAAVPGVQLQPATHDANGVALHAVQLVLRAPRASRVTVVGDFNGWDSEATAMTRDPASGLWSHTLALRPGRHVYAFVVDDSVWMRDPRAPEALDADFGRPGSVLLVGQP